MSVGRLLERSNKKRDARRSRRFYRKACRGKVAAACHRLGDMYRDGLGGRRNFGAARKYFRLACRLGREDACKR